MSKIVFTEQAKEIYQKQGLGADVRIKYYVLVKDAELDLSELSYEDILADKSKFVSFKETANVNYDDEVFFYIIGSPTIEYSPRQFTKYTITYPHIEGLRVVFIGEDVSSKKDNLFVLGYDEEELDYSLFIIVDINYYKSYYISFNGPEKGEIEVVDESDDIFFKKAKDKSTINQNGTKFTGVYDPLWYNIDRIVFGEDSSDFSAIKKQIIFNKPTPGISTTNNPKAILTVHKPNNYRDLCFFHTYNRDRIGTISLKNNTLIFNIHTSNIQRPAQYSLNDHYTSNGENTTYSGNYYNYLGLNNNFTGLVKNLNDFILDYGSFNTNTGSSQYRSSYQEYFFLNNDWGKRADSYTECYGKSFYSAYNCTGYDFYYPATISISKAIDIGLKQTDYSYYNYSAGVTEGPLFFDELTKYGTNTGVPASLNHISFNNSSLIRTCFANGVEIGTSNFFGYKSLNCTIIGNNKDSVFEAAFNTIAIGTEGLYDNRTHENYSDGWGFLTFTSNDAIGNDNIKALVRNTLYNRDIYFNTSFIKITDPAESPELNLYFNTEQKILFGSYNGESSSTFKFSYSIINPNTKDDKKFNEGAKTYAENQQLNGNRLLFAVGGNPSPNKQINIKKSNINVSPWTTENYYYLRKRPFKNDTMFAISNYSIPIGKFYEPVYLLDINNSNVDKEKSYKELYSANFVDDSVLGLSRNEYVFNGLYVKNSKLLLGGKNIYFHECDYGHANSYDVSARHLTIDLDKLYSAVKTQTPSTLSSSAKNEFDNSYKKLDNLIKTIQKKSNGISIEFKDGAYDVPYPYLWKLPNWNSTDKKVYYSDLMTLYKSQFMTEQPDNTYLFIFIFNNSSSNLTYVDKNNNSKILEAGKVYKLNVSYSDFV